MFVSKANLFVRLNNCSHETRLSQLGGDKYDEGYLPLLIEIELEKKSQPRNVPHPPNQFLGWDFFASFYSKTALMYLPIPQYSI